MAYKVPTLEQMTQFLLALFKALLPDRNSGSRWSFYRKLLKTIAGAATDIHANVSSAAKDVMPDTSKGAMQDRWLGIYGLERKGATPARRTAAGRVRGLSGSTVEVGDLLVHRASGLSFQIDQDATIPIGGSIDVDIAAVDKGSATRLEAGQVLEFSSPPAGVQTAVKLVLPLDQDGVDAELDGAARVRLLAATGTPAAGGNQSDYVKWALAQTGIAASFCYPNRAGLGSIDVAALHSGSGSARTLQGGEPAALLLALQALAPAQVGGTGGPLRILTVVTTTQRVELKISPDGQPQNEFDWSDTGPPTVASWNPATRELQFSGGALPATLTARDRICFDGLGSTQTGEQFVVESISGVDKVILQTAPTNNPVAGDLIYSGGPLVDTIRDAVIAHMNGDILYAGPSGPLPAAIADTTIALEVLADGMGTANPAGVYGPWVGGLYLSNLAKIAAYTPGVRNQVIVLPVADVEATDYTFPLDNQIGLLVPGQVLVRRA